MTQTQADGIMMLMTMAIVVHGTLLIVIAIALDDIKDILDDRLPKKGVPK